MGAYRRELLLALTLCCAAGGAPIASAGEMDVESAGYSFTAPVKTLKELRFRRVVKQEYDFSCGSAAIATLLTYHYKLPTLEDTVLQAMFATGDQEKIRHEGFSMLDMKTYLESLGYRTEGYNVSLDKIAQVGVPGIVLIRTKGYLHFVVLKGVRGDQVLVGDSALGTKFMTREKFLDVWNGVFLVILSDLKEAKTEFNRDQDWEGQVAAPLGGALSRDTLATMTLLMPGRNSF
jgi:predicted double-glycine peptidase